MRLTMLGYYGFGNAGDEAVLAAEVAALREALGEDTEFVVVSGDVSHTRRIHDLDGVSRTDFRGIVEELRSADALVAGGGSLLQDVTSARPVAYYGGLMLLARRFGKPVFCYAQGLGPIRRRTNRMLAGRALRAASYVSLRDLDSVRLAESMKVSDLDVVPDPVLGLDLSTDGSGPAPAGSGPGEPASALAVALRPWDGQQEWLESVVSVLSELAGQVELRFVPFHEGQDLEMARELAERVGSGSWVVQPDGGYRAALSAIAGCRAVLGMRLHALIAAAAAGRPFVALSYDPKVTAFAGGIGQPVAATLPGTVRPEPLRNAVAEALSGRAPLDPELVAELRQEARRPAVRIAEALHSST